MQVEDPDTQKLTLRVMDDETFERSEYIGSAGLAINEVNLLNVLFLNKIMFLSLNNHLHLSCMWLGVDLRTNSAKFLNHSRLN